MTYVDGIARGVAWRRSWVALLASGATLLPLLTVAPHIAVGLASALLPVVPPSQHHFVTGHGVYHLEHAMHVVAVVASVAVALIVTTYATPGQAKPLAQIRRAFGVASSHTGRFRWRLFLLATGIATPILGGAVVLDVARRETITWQLTSHEVTTIAFAAMLYPLQAAGQEYLFRAWPMVHARLVARTPWAVPLAMTAATIAFTLNHTRTPDLLMVDIFCFSLIMWWVTSALGGVEAAIALHMVTNIAMMSASMAWGQSASFEWGGMTQTVAVGVVIDVVSMAVAAVATVAIYRATTKVAHS